MKLSVSEKECISDKSYDVYAIEDPRFRETLLFSIKSRYYL